MIVLRVYTYPSLMQRIKCGIDFHVLKYVFHPKVLNLPREDLAHQL
jgi:hypothetical protein